MKYLRRFDSEAEFDLEYAYGNIVFPCVCLVGKEIRYYKKHTPQPESASPLYVEAFEDLTVSFSTNAIQYSLDGIGWMDLPAATATPVILAGSKVYFRASGLTTSSSNGMGTFSMTGKCQVGGNAMSMLYGAEYESETAITVTYAFNALFKNATTLMSAHKLSLPATTLYSYCYKYMFQGCTSLLNAPELPATTLYSYCYQYMFQGCTSLLNAPELPATKLYSNCYHYMFSKCTSLVESPAIHATDVRAEECCGYMYEGCTSLQVARVPQALTMYNKCYRNMFQDCKALEEAPELPATTLANYCYGYMFAGCTSLKKAPRLPATTLYGYCYPFMFQDCKALEEAPELPAKTLQGNCYQSMFSGCSKLRYIKAMFTTTPSSSYLSAWVNGVASEGTFIKNSAATWENTFGTSAIPTGWTVETADA